LLNILFNLVQGL